MFYSNSTLDKIVDNFFSNTCENLSMFNSTIIKKYYDLPSIVRDENGVEIKLTLPGYEKEDLEISIHGDILTICTVDNISDTIDEFKRTFQLMDDIDQDSCTAEIKAGILKISFKYKKQKKSKKITIK